MTAMDSSRAMPKSLKRARLRRNFQKFAPYYFMLLPAIVYVAIFNYAPLYGLQIAFKDFKGSLGFAASRWVGLNTSSAFLKATTFGSCCATRSRCRCIRWPSGSRSRLSWR